MNHTTYRYQELDALRGIAALMVVLFHFTTSKYSTNFKFNFGIAGVDLFFIISGFVIFMSLNKVKSSRDFIINRVSRLYPAYWTCVTFTFSVMLAYSIYKHNDISFVQYIGNMTMFQYYLRIPDIDGPYWTMIIEMIFYICMLVIFYFKLMNRLIPIGLILTIMVVLLTSFYYNNFTYQLLTYIPLLQFIPLFLAGILFYNIYIEKKKFLEKYFILIICLVSQILLYDYSGRSRYFISQNEYAIMLVIYFLLFTLFIHGKLKIIVCKATLFLGKISFPLYLIHQYISLNFIIPILIKKFHFNFWIASLFFALPMVIGLATIVTYYIEIPLSKIMKEKLLTTRILLKNG